jgi:hypothetical protein
LAINWSASIRFKRNFTFFSTLSTNSFIHRSSRHSPSQLLALFNANPLVCILPIMHNTVLSLFVSDNGVLVSLFDERETKSDDLWIC